MSLRIDWHPAALKALYDLRWTEGAKVDGAIIRYAETGRGDVARLSSAYLLRAGSYSVIFSLDRDAESMCVLWIYLAR